MKTDTINLRVEPELKKKLKAVAKKDKRSLNTICEIFLEKGIEEFKKRL